MFKKSEEKFLVHKANKKRKVFCKKKKKLAEQQYVYNKNGMSVFEIFTLYREKDEAFKANRKDSISSYLAVS